MPDTSQIRELCERIGSLLSMRGELQSAVAALASALENNFLLPEDAVFSVRDRIPAISGAQTEILEDYSRLNLGDFPETLSDALSRLEHREQEILRKARFTDAVQFFCSLTTDDPAVLELLDSHRTFLASLDIMEMAEEACEEQIGKYIRFIEAVQEESQETRFGLLLQLNGQFEIKLLFALNCSTIVPVEKLPVPQVLEELPVTEEPTVIEEPPVTEEPTVFEESPITEAPPVVEEPPVTAEPPVIKEPPVTAVSVKDESITWENLGITDPEAVCVHPDESLLVRTETERKKEFRPVDVQSDLKKMGVFPAQRVMNSVKEHFGSTPELISFWKSCDQAEAEAYCELLLERDYLVRYTYKGYEPLYVLSSRGIRIYTSEKAAGYMASVLHKKERLVIPFEETAGSVLSRILAYRGARCLSSVCPKYPFHKGGISIERYAAILEFEKAFKKRSIVFLSLISSDPAAFAETRAILQDDLNKDSVLVFVGVSLTNAKALHTWFTAQIDAEDRRFWYLDAET